PEAGPGLRVRLPRGELRHVQHAERGARHREGASRKAPVTLIWRRAVRAGAVAAAMVSLAAALPSAQSGAYKAPRTPDGKPNLSGIWQALNTANWDLQAHGARAGF